MIRPALVLAALALAAPPAHAQPHPTNLGDLVLVATAEARAEFEALNTRVSFPNTAPHPSFDGSNLTLSWARDGATPIVAEAEVTGSYSLPHAAFVWSWFNPTIPDSLSTAAIAVPRFGEAHGIEQLTTDRLTITPQLAGGIAATATLIGDLDAIYSLPQPNGETVYFDLRRVAEGPSQ